MKYMVTKDDLTGRDGETESFKLTIGGDEVELDLLPASVAVFRALASKNDAERESVPAMLAAMFTSDTPAVDEPPATPTPPAHPAATVSEIREWAKTQPHLRGKIKPQGRLPVEVTEEYHAAHPK